MFFCGRPAESGGVHHAPPERAPGTCTTLLLHSLVVKVCARTTKNRIAPPSRTKPTARFVRFEASVLSSVCISLL